MRVRRWFPRRRRPRTFVRPGVRSRALEIHFAADPGLWEWGVWSIRDDGALVRRYFSLGPLELVWHADLWATR